MKFYSTLILLLFISSIMPALSQQEWKQEYFIRPGGIYTLNRTTNTFTLFIKINDSLDNVKAKMTRPYDRDGSTDDTFYFMDCANNMKPYGLIFYSFYVIVPPEYRYGIGDLVKNTVNPTIKSIGIHNSSIRTVKGIGIGSTVKELYDAHGKSPVDWFYYDNQGWCLEYGTSEGRIYFSVGQTSAVTLDSKIGAIYLTD